MIEKTIRLLFEKTRYLYWKKHTIKSSSSFPVDGFHSCTGVTRLVDEYRNRPDRYVIHNLNGHTIMIKLK